MKFTFLKKIFLLAVVLFSVSKSIAQVRTLSNDAHVSVLTCGAGNESYSLFGHTAIRVNDVVNNLDVVYNYGAFDFQTPNFVMKFAKGDLNYFIIVHHYIDFINEYNYEQRSVYEQELKIPQAIKQQLYDNLTNTLMSEERLYKYKFIDNNCTSKVVDIINKTLGAKVITKRGDTDLSFRTILYPYFDNHFYEKLGTSIIFGTKVDQLGTKIFLPFELQKSLQVTQYQNHLLCPENKTLLFFEKQNPTSWWNNCYSYLLVLGAILLINKKRVDFTYLFIISLLGLFFVFMGFFSSHQELAYNYNILLFNPLLFLVFYFYFTKNPKWIYRAALFNIAFLILYFLVMINKIHLLIVAPLFITNLVILVRLAIRNKKRIPIIIYLLSSIKKNGRNCFKSNVQIKINTSVFNIIQIVLQLYQTIF